MGASRLLFENGYIDRWNPDLGVHEAMAELLPHKDKWEFPRDQLKLGNIWRKIKLKSFTEKIINTFQYNIYNIFQ